jgi:hypothetical protein
MTNASSIKCGSVREEALTILHRLTCPRAHSSAAVFATRRGVHAARTGAREASCADFGVGFWGFNPKPE